MADGVRRIVAFALAMGVFALDRWSKWLVETQLNAYDTRTVIPGFFNIVRSENPGVAFGIFSESPTHSRTLILVVFSVVAVLLLAAMLWRIDRLDTISAWGLALIFGGAMGNVFDRVHVGRVTDFLDFYFGNYHWYTFNVADASICTGAGLLILSMLLAQKHAAGVTRV
ncbi:MAG TPA: signal peptidase II [Bryobacteraceae bacterium]|jgi:signal peptidase II|nr:signal peptidase II [Bryobacteraceae bacterium]